MGVKGLWQLVGPAGKSISLESLEGKILAIDVSIWLNKAAKGMRDKHGNQVYNAHLVLMFHRICKLLFYGVKPVFVFDGGVPELKKNTLRMRRQRRARAENGKVKTKQTMLNNFLQRKALEVVTGTKSSLKLKMKDEKEPDMFELSPLASKDNQSSSSSEDEMKDEEQWLEVLTSDRVKIMFDDPGSVDIESEEFKSLPSEVKHEILTEIKDFQRRRYKQKHEVEIDLPEDADDFSTFQMDNLVKRGKITQQIDQLRKDMNKTVTTNFLAIHDADDKLNYKNKCVHMESKTFASNAKERYVLIKSVKSKEGNRLFDTDLDNDYLRFKERNKTSAAVHDCLKKLERIPAKFEHMKSSMAVGFISDDSSDDDNFKTLTKVNKDEVEFMTASSSSDSELLETEGLSVSNLTDREVIISGERLEVTLSVNNIDKNSVDKENLDKSIEEVLIGEKVYTDKGNLSTNIIIGENLERNVINLNVEKSDGKISINDKITVTENLNVSSKQKRNNNIDLEKGDRPFSLDVKIMQPAELCVNNSAEKMNTDQDNEEMNASSSTIKVNISNDTTSSTLFSPSVNEHNEFFAEQTSPSVNKEFINAFTATVAKKSKEELSAYDDDLRQDVEKLRKVEQKQTRQAATLSSEMYQDVQELLGLFGMPYLVSPMEAEAQCAYLDYSKLTDGSITDDSDIFLFGGQCVYKNIFNQKKYAELFDAKDMKAMFYLDRHKLIAIAFLTGSDYTYGLQGIGGITAMEILHEFAQINTQDTLAKLKEWMVKVKNGEHVKNPGSNLGTKLKQVEMPKNFNDPIVWQAYLEPTVDVSEERFEWGEPDVDAIKEYPFLLPSCFTI